MAGNGWAIVALNNEDDATVDYVLSTDEITFLPVGADIPNPLWVNDGANTTPDTAGRARYLPFDALNWNSAQIYLDDKFPVEDVRGEKADFQKSNTALNVEMRRVTVTVVPV